MSVNSPLFITFLELMNTSQVFRNNHQAYNTIRKYAFDYVSYVLKQNPSFFQQMEYQEFQNQLFMFNSEVSNKGNTIYYDKGNYENFVCESFRPINFENCDRNTAVIASSLISVMSLYGDIPEKFASHQNYLKYRITQLDQESHLKISQPVSSVIPNPNIQKFLDQNKSKDINTNTNNNGNNSVEVVKSNSNNRMVVNINHVGEKRDTGFKAKGKKDDTIPKDQNPFFPNEATLTGQYTGGKVSFDSLVNKNIIFPISKGSYEYKCIKEVIKEHLIYSEQEALFNKIDNSKAHLTTALYYLKGIN